MHSSGDLCMRCIRTGNIQAWEPSVGAVRKEKRVLQAGECWCQFTLVDVTSVTDRLWTN